MYCSKCGSENRDNVAFCKECGTSFGNNNANVHESIENDAHVKNKKKFLVCSWQNFWGFVSTARYILYLWRAIYCWYCIISSWKFFVKIINKSKIFFISN